MEVMELESLESLWFYGNVLSNSKPSVLSDSFSSLTFTKHVEEEEQEEHESVEEEVLHIVEAEKKSEEEFKAEALGVVVVVVVEESDVADTLDFPSLSTTREEERRRRRRMRARSKKGMHRNMRRKILGELDLGGNGDGFFVDEGLGFKSGHQRLNLDDNMAMKEHLKTWAHAVACTVR